MARREDAELVLTGAQIYSHYVERLINMALSQFDWRGLPDTMDPWYWERVAFMQGRVAAIRPEGSTFWLGLDFVATSGRFNVYGYPTTLTAIDFNGRNIKAEEFILMYDNATRTSMLPAIHIYAKQLYEIHQTFRSNLKHQNVPYIVTTNKNQLLSIRNIFRRIFSFDPVIEVKEGFSGDKITDAIDTLDLRVPFIGNDLLDAQREIWAAAISRLGISAETTKKERLIADEIAVNRQEDTVNLNARLQNRIQFANRFNEKYGTEISVNLAEQPITLESLYTGDLGVDSPALSTETDPKDDE